MQHAHTGTGQGLLSVLSRIERTLMFACLWGGHRRFALLHIQRQSNAVIGITILNFYFYFFPIRELHLQVAV